MKIRAYDEMYLDSAQNILGHMFDYALNEAELDPDDFSYIFSASPASKQFEIGNPGYVAGCTGPELAKKVIKASGMSVIFPEEVMYEDKSPEYWAGWALAYYQWSTSYSFAHIFKALPFSYTLKMYNTYHEMDILKFTEAADERMKSYYKEHPLKRYRRRLSLSQNALSTISGVPLRQIQLFEQGKRDITKTQASTLYKLSKALGCSMENLLQP